MRQRCQKVSDLWYSTEAEISYVGGKKQSNLVVQGRCATAAWGFYNDLTGTQGKEQSQKPEQNIFKTVCQLKCKVVMFAGISE